MSKKVFITGGTIGIGLEVCKLYLANGYIVGTCSFGPKEKVIITSSIQYYQVDVTNAHDLSLAMNDFSKKHNGIDIIIANAGIRMDKSKIPDFSFGAKVIEVNVIGVLNTFGPAIEILKNNGGGSLAAIGSISGITGMPGMAIYGASKSAVINLCESLSIDLKEFNIDVSAIAPGFIKTEQTSKNKHKMPFMLTPAQAAKHIKNAIDKKRPLYLFPFPMKLIAKVLYFLPRRLYRKLMMLDLLGMQRG